MHKISLYDVFRKTMVQLYIKNMPKTPYRVKHMFGLSCAICIKCARKIKEKHTIYTKTL